MPQKMFEYMAAGLPIIASDFPLWREIIGGIGCGILVDSLQPNAIAAAIEFILAHPNEAEEMGSHGQAAVLAHYNWETQAKKLIDLYSGLLEPVCAE
jgi:glycosyltransferase involved in cell wall biosynthesis